MYCHNCGTKTDGNFCPNCGTAIKTDYSQNDGNLNDISYEAYNEKSNRDWLITLLFAYSSAFWGYTGSMQAKSEREFFICLPVVCLE